MQYMWEYQLFCVRQHQFMQFYVWLASSKCDGHLATTIPILLRQKIICWKATPVVELQSLVVGWTFGRLKARGEVVHGLPPWPVFLAIGVTTVPSSWGTKPMYDTERSLAAGGDHMHFWKEPSKQKIVAMVVLCLWDVPIYIYTTCDQTTQTLQTRQGSKQEYIELLVLVIVWSYHVLRAFCFTVCSSLAC